MSIFDLFRSEQDQKVSALKKALKKNDQGGKGRVPHLLDIVDSGITQQTVDLLLQSQKLDFYAEEKASFLKQLVAAKDGLDNGKIEAVVNLHMVGHDSMYFKHLTGGKPTLAKAKAKELLARETHKPSGDHGDPHFNNTVNFAMQQQREAITDYAELGMAQEAEQAMRNYIEIDVYSKKAKGSLVRTAVTDGPILQEAAFNVVDEQGLLDTNTLHNIVKQSNENDSLRTKAMKSLTIKLKETTNSLAFGTFVFGSFAKIAAQDCANEDAMPESQKLAITLLSQDKYYTDLHDKISNVVRHDTQEQQDLHGSDIKSGDIKSAALYQTPVDEYYGAIKKHVQNGNEFVLDTVFGTHDAIHSFMIDYVRHENNAGGKEPKNKTGILRDLMPVDVKGEKIAKSRNHFAQKIALSVTGNYHTSDENRFISSDADAVVASNLISDIVMDSSVLPDHPERAKALQTLRSIDMSEQNAIAKRQAYADKHIEQHHQPDDIAEGFDTAAKMQEFLSSAQYITPEQGKYIAPVVASSNKPSV